MAQPETQAPIHDTLDELEADVRSQEDAETVEQWRDEVEAERQAALSSLGKKPVERLVQMPDGSVATHSEVQRIRENGQDASSPYRNGQR